MKVLGKQYSEVNRKTGKLLNGASQKTADNLSSLQIHHRLGFSKSQDSQRSAANSAAGLMS